jgi:hypothetical protein
MSSKELKFFKTDGLGTASHDLEKSGRNFQFTNPAPHVDKINGYIG